VVGGVLQRPLAVPLVNWSTFGFVRVEHRRRRLAPEHGGELPAQVLRVVDRAGQAQPAGRRVAVSGVAKEDHAADAEGRGDDRFHGPSGGLVNAHRQAPDPERQPHVGLDLGVRLRARIVDWIVQMDHPLLRCRPPPIRPHRNHDDERTGLRRENPADQDVRITRERREVGGDVQRRSLGEDAEPFHVHPDQIWHAAAAVSSDQVAAADHVLPPRRAIADGGQHDVFVLLEADELVTEPDPSR
jgi:hypothetical protein